MDSTKNEVKENQAVHRDLFFAWIWGWKYFTADELLKAEKEKGERGATLIARPGREVETSYVTNSQRERMANTRIRETGRKKARENQEKKSFL